MNVTIIGGGNIGMVLAGEISRLKDYDVTMYVSSPDCFAERIFVQDSEKHITFKSGPIQAVDDLEQAVSDADLILCTYPSHLRRKLLEDMEPYVKKGASIGFFPGYGGAELFCGRLMEKGVTVFALQKVPYVARTVERGKIAGLWSKKTKIKVAAIPRDKTEEIASLLENILQIECVRLDNYLAATLLPGNPLLHTSGSYVYLKDYKEGQTFPEQIYYYQSWNDECSRVICSFSDEMMAICKAIPMDLSEVESIQGYYESPTPEALTEKFHSIPSFHMLTLPMKKTDNGFVPDFNSRFYTEDIPNGVCILKALALLTGTEVPVIDMILDWYRRMTGKEYLSKDGTYGKDIQEAAIPQLNGITTIRELTDFYAR